MLNVCVPATILVAANNEFSWAMAKNLLLCGEVFVVLAALMSLCFLPWEQTVAWMLLVLPLLLAGVLYLLLYYWEKHYQFFS